MLQIVGSEGRVTFNSLDAVIGLGNATVIDTLGVECLPAGCRNSIGFPQSRLSLWWSARACPSATRAPVSSGPGREQGSERVAGEAQRTGHLSPNSLILKSNRGPVPVAFPTRAAGMRRTRRLGHHQNPSSQDRLDFSNRL